MRYLKKFNESKDVDVIRDICLELKDMGISVNFNRNSFSEYQIFIGYWNDEKMMLWKDVKDSILRLKDYLGDDIKKIYFADYYDEDIKFKDVTDNTKFSHIDIIIKKNRLYSSNLTKISNLGWKIKESIKRGRL